MSKVTVAADSVSGLSPELARRFNLKVIPAACIVFDGTYYADGEGISAEEAYRLLALDPDKFSTSPFSPSELVEVYRRLSGGSDKIIIVHFSSAVSAAFSIACSAADLLMKEKPGLDIRIIDSKAAAAVQGLLAIAAAQAADRGADIDAIVDFLPAARAQTDCIMMLDTLKYVYRTGRFSKTTARIASLLHVKPLNRITAEGTFEVVGKVTRRKDGYKKMLEYIHRNAPAEALTFMISHASAPEMAGEFADMLRQEFNCLDILFSQYSPIMGYAAGPKCIAVGFQPELKLPEAV